MLVNFESLENTSRVWIYQSTREFSKSEVEIINDKSLKLTVVLVMMMGG